MTDPIGFFFTWPTYGTWLPGDGRGWVEYHHGWQLPDEPKRLQAAAKMKEDACCLSPEARQLVLNQVAETCRHRHWLLHAVNCRSNHMHVVVGAFDANPTKIRRDIKAYCTRKLKTAIDATRENWWAERGSIRYIWNEGQLERVVAYVSDAQDRKHLDNMETRGSGFGEATR